ncbi:MULTISPECIES: DUF2177 family protein [Rhizobium]|uniref:DUF2177 family protein n=1 Tax=Rhizobium straminoryzae TaxID=1387186 RepID=A0A549T3F8_9HYPH|nr:MULTISPECIES: DUF2177 family protein [Rhizobium]TRL36401.1 DUF2177 family protein [Rhizobium straminoryzae]
MTYALAYGATALVFFGLDFLWLGHVATGFYRNQLGDMMRERPDFVAAGLFYLVYVAGIVYFAVGPNLAGGGLRQAALSGAILGLIAYGTYDITNLATLKNWPLAMSLVDLAWGTALTATAATAGVWITEKILG